MLHSIKSFVSIHKFRLCLGICLTLCLLYYLWKRIFGRILANCWFCNHNCKVKYKSRNSWTCPSCKQYNGFDKSGDYNKLLPEMYDEKLNYSKVAKNSKNENLNKICQEVKLCDRCSRNQVLKYKQLSQFKPLSENNFEIEVEHYKKNLEKLYCLCSHCQNASSRFIKLQDTILRGRLLSNLKPNKKIKNVFASAPSKMFLSKYWAGCFIHLSMLYFIMLLACVAFPSTSFSVIFLDHLPYSVLFQQLFHSDQFGHLVCIGGFLLSLASYIYMDNFYQKFTIFYVFVWMYFFATKIWVMNLNLNQIKDFGYFNSIQYFIPPLALKISFVTIISIFLLYKCLGYLLMQVISGSKPDNNLIKNKCPNFKSNKCPSKNINRAEPLFSDQSENEDEAMEVMGENSASANTDLNGSLNALKLQDNVSCNIFNIPKHSVDFYANPNLPSSLNTPPPSRSSSLLSLSSHHSNVKPTNPINKFGSTLHFARPSSELPFQRYKAASAVGCWTNSSFPTRSVVTSLSQRNLPNKSLLQPDQDFKKPLISPAKLQWFSKGKYQRQQIFDDSDKNCGEIKENSFGKDCDAEISVFDSVSQVGEKIYSELSDDDDVPRTPVNSNKPDLNSSSPKSTISNITSITMKSVAEVENSRLCRWILAACLLVNLVLVVLLIQEVKEMRKMEQWKSKTSL